MLIIEEDRIGLNWLPLTPKIRSEFDSNGEFYRPNFWGEGGNLLSYRESLLYC